MSIEVLERGLLTTVQDLGRHGHQREGVPVSGAMDTFALRAANLLVGNPPGAAGLETTLIGPALRFVTDALVAVTGAEPGAEVDGVPVPCWRPVRVPGGATLRFHPPTRGCRAYLAVAGGVDVPVVLGSRSTYLPAALGGIDGRALREGDRLPVGSPSPLGRRIADSLHRGDETTAARWGIAPSARPRYSQRPVVRLIPGTHAGALTDAARRALHGAEFRVSTRSDRMGFRLEGPPLEWREPLEILSEAVAFGTLQLPPDGAPILLMADRQTTGGYPRIGEVADVDLPLVAQLRPGDRLVFQPVSLADAQALALSRERDLEQARHAIALLHR